MNGTTNKIAVGSDAVKTVERINKPPFSVRLKRDLSKNWLLYLIFLPVAIYFILFYYAPMAGVVMAFEDFRPSSGIFHSQWVGLKNFKTLFLEDNFLQILRNTSMMALLNLTIGFIVPVIFALLLSSIRHKRFKRVIQISSYMPYFIATVVVVQLWTEFLGRSGVVTTMLTWFGFENQNWLANPDMPVFWIINCVIEIWVGCGYGAIIYCAAISNINPELFEAAALDGANEWQRALKITVPTILPLIVTMFTLRVGMIFKQGFDKVILLQMPATYVTSDCLMTFINRIAFSGTADYSLAAAAGLFESVIATVLLIVSNHLNRKATNSSLF